MCPREDSRELAGLSGQSADGLPDGPIDGPVSGLVDGPGQERVDKRTAPELSTLFRVDVGPGLVRVHGVVDGVSVPVVLEAVSLAAAKAPDGQVQVQLGDVGLLSASSTRWLQHAIDQAWEAGVMVTLVAPRGSVANRVITSIRRLLGPHAHRLPLDPDRGRSAHGQTQASGLDIVNQRDWNPPTP